MLDMSKIYKTNNSGDLRIVNYINYSCVEVEFISTGYTTKTSLTNIKSGSVKDKLYRSVFGVGFIGGGTHKPSVKGKYTATYRAWVNMLSRCYCEKSQQPTYKDCMVCDEWHNFQNFADWYGYNYADGLHLDKDIKFEGNKIYSPDTCMFVNQKSNTIKAHARYYTFTSPKGNVINVYNLAKFCRDNELSHSYMSSLYLGKINQYKGYRLLAKEIRL